MKKKIRPNVWWLAWGTSVLLHIALIVGPELREWLQTADHEETALRATQRKLKSQRPIDQPAAKKQHPNMQFTVHLRGPDRGVAATSPAVIEAASVSEPVKPRRAKASPVKVAVVASQVNVASAPASRPAAVASAPVPASAVVMARAETGVASMGASAPAAAKAAPGAYPSLERFPQDIRITYAWGPFLARTHWRVGNGHYDFEMQGNAFGKFMRVESRGQVNQDGIRPERYIEYHRIDLAEPKYLVNFNWANKTVELGGPRDRKIEPLAEGDQDFFSAALHLALVGGDKPEYKFSLFSGRKRYQDIQFKAEGEATLRFGRRDVEAILVRGRWNERRADFWLAPQWHNLPVRMDLSLGNMGYDLWATRIEIDGQEVMDEFLRVEEKD